MGQQGKHLNSIKVSHEKHTAGCATEIMAIPETVCISMSQHIGAPCKPLVKKGDQVKVGQLIGDTDAFVSAPIHSSVSGTVKEISTIRSVTGGDDQVVIIETDGNQDVYEEIKPPVINDMKDFIAAVRASGLVGLGGASFPTHIKLNPKNLEEVDTLIVNAAECEPFITEHGIHHQRCRGYHEASRPEERPHRRGGKQAGCYRKAQKGNCRHGSLRGHRSERSQSKIPAGRRTSYDL